MSRSYLNISRDEPEADEGLLLAARVGLLMDRDGLPLAEWQQRRKHVERVAAVEHLGEQFQVIARWEVIGERSEPTLVSIFTVPPRPLSADAIRRLPLGSVLAGMRRDLAWEGKVGVGTESDQGRRRRAVARSATGPQRGSALSSDDLQAVSEAYRRAWREGRPVTVAIAEQFHIAPSTAAKRIMAARRAGLLDGVGPRVTR